MEGIRTDSKGVNFLCKFISLYFLVSKHYGKSVCHTGLETGAGRGVKTIHGENTWRISAFPLSDLQLLSTEPAVNSVQKSPKQAASHISPGKLLPNEARSTLYPAPLQPLLIAPNYIPPGSLSPWGVCPENTWCFVFSGAN